MNGDEIYLSTKCSWSKQYDDPCERFRILSSFRGEAVLDRETGLVWERTLSGKQGTWYDAVSEAVCSKNIGGRLGWRLPWIEELASLLDRSQSSGPFLPAGHPFVGVLENGPVYYSVTSLRNSKPPNAFAMRPYDGTVVTIRKDDPSGFVWYCRTGPGYEPEIQSTSSKK